MEIDKKPNGRDASGRFIPGAPAGPGRPPRQTEREYLDAMIAECPIDTWRRIVARAVQDAEAGDERARAWLSTYLIGRPISLVAEIRETPADDFLGMNKTEAIEFLRRRGRIMTPEDRRRLVTDGDPPAKT